MNKQKKFNQQNSKLILEELEERRLFSGGIEGLIVTGLDSDENALYADADANKSQTADTKGEAATSAAEQQSHEIVFVDAGVDNHQQLVDDLLANSDTSRNIEVVVLDRDQDGIEQISAVLQDRDDLDALHIISHGSDGSIELGNNSLNSETLEDNNLKIALWANAFAESGDILIYGCNLASTEVGQKLISDLGGLTLTDVAASDDLTGAAALGGDWELEYATGSIESRIAVSSAAQDSWSGVLFTVDTFADTTDANPGNGVAEDGSGNTSIRAAVEEANALAGADNISIGAGTFTLSGGELTISSDVTITGAGEGVTIIDGDSLSRIFNITSGTVTISDLTIQNGDASGQLGGAILNDGDLVLNNVSLADNTAKEGGGVASSASSSLTVNGGSMTGNAAENGGAIWIKDSVTGLALSNVTLDGNSATDLGGGIFNEAGPMQINGGTISGNTALEGGGIYFKGDDATLTNVTISGNSATTLGGGLNNNAGNLNATNVTITDNTAATGSGIHRAGGTVSIQNSIVAANSGSADVSGAYTSLGYNLIGNGDGSSGFTDGVNGDQVGTAGLPLDPMLGALADNGGPTQTHALLAGGPAIDSGDPTVAPMADNRGYTRVGTSDIGAFEFAAMANVPAAEDPFGYATGNLGGNGGGSGWATAWSGAGTLQVVGSSLSHPTGGLDTGGGAVELNAPPFTVPAMQGRDLTNSLGDVNETVWASFLLQPDETSDPNNSYMGLTFGTGGVANTNQLFVGYTGTDFKLNNWGGGGTNIDVPGVVSGETVFLVVKIDILASGNETATLYINPTAGLGTPDVAGSATKTDLDLGTFDTISIVGARAGAANLSQMDQIRIGSSYADVAPVTNTAPTAANNTVITNEDTDYVFSASDFNFSDADAGDTLQQVKITSLPANGTLKLSGVDVTLNQAIDIADIDAGNLVFEPAADQSGSGYDSFDFMVSDGNSVGTSGTVLNSFAAPAVNSMSGVAHDGTNIWLAGQNADTIYQLDTDGNVLNSFAAPGTSPTGIAFDGTNLWIISRDNDMVYEVDTSGNVLSSFATPGTDTRGLTWDGTSLWLVEGNGSLIYELTTTGSVVSSFGWPSDYMRDIAWDGSSLWVSDQNDQVIRELNTSGTELSSFAAPSSGAAGLAFDGTEFWHADADTDLIYQIASSTSVQYSASAYTMTIDVTDVNDAPTMTAWFNDAWDSRKSLTVSSAQVAGDVTNFPVLITLNTDAELAAQALANGDDIVFTAADGVTQLAHEIEFFDETTGELRVWVKTDLSGSVDTDIYMYFGNAASGNQENIPGVWDNYVGVYHLGESPTGAPGEISDSSGSGNHGTTEGVMDAADSVSTTIGQGLAFDGSNDMIRIPNSASLDSINDEATFSLWINFVNSADGDTQIVMTSADRYTTGAVDGYEWASQGDGDHFFYPDAGVPDVNYNLGADPFTNGAWHHLAATMDFTTKEVKIYVDGTPMTFSYEGTTGNWTTPTTSTADLLWGGNPDRATRFFNGMMDEIRIADVARSQEWIQTEYNNQKTPGTFFSVGTSEDREDKLTDINEDDFTSAGNSVLSIITSSGADRITDDDSGAVEGIAVSGVDDTNGQWQYDANADGTWLAFGAVTETNAVLLDTGALIRFVPNADYNGSAGDLTFHAWDQTSAANGDIGVDVSTNGGSTAYSSETFDASLNVIAVNDDPIINSDGGGATANINVAENTTAVTTVTATDVDLDTPTFSITGGADQGLFTLLPTGELSFLVAPDFEGAGDNLYEVEVTASDGAGGTDVQSITVRVTDAPEGIRVTPTSVVPIGGETLVNTETTGVQTISASVSQAIATDASGNYVVVWASDLQDSSGWGVYAQLFNADGTSQGGEIPLNTTVTNNQLSPSVAMDDAGNFVVAWQSENQDGSGYGVYTRRFDAAGNPLSGETLVNTETADYQGSPGIAMAPNGDYVVIWTSSGQDNPDGDSGIYAQFFNADGSTNGGEFLVNTYTAGHQQVSSVSMDDNGNFVVTWGSQNQDGSNYGVFAQLFDSNGTAFGPEFQVNTTFIGAQLYNDVAMLGDGRFVVTYQHWNADTSADLFMQMFNADGSTHGSEIQVNTASDMDYFPIPSVTADDSGNITLAWQTTNDGNLSGVYVRSYDWSGNPLSGEILANTTTTGHQQYADVVAQPGGGFIVVWGGSGPGDTDGVFTQRYGLQTQEGGVGTSFQLVLESAPSDDVVIPISVSDGSEGSVSVGSITFTSGDWNIPQTVNVTSIDDLVIDGTQVYTINIGPATSTDPGFNGLDPANLTVTNLDFANTPPTITSDGGGAAATINLDESMSTVTRVTATDIDLDTATFSITGGADQALFNIDASSGVLTFVNPPNYEGPGDNSYDVQVTADDGRGGTDVQLITVNIANLDPVANGAWFDETNGGSGYANFASMAAAHNAYLGTVEQTIDFEGLTPGDVLSNQYTVSHGVTFSNTGINQSQIYAEGGAWIENLTGYDGSYAADGSNVYLKMANDDPASPFTIDFASPVSKVGAMLGMGKEGTNHDLYVKLYDSGGNLLDEQILEAELWDVSSTDNNYETFLGVSYDSAVISKIEILNASNVNYANALIVDQLQFSATPDMFDEFNASTGIATVTGNVLTNDIDPAGGALTVSGFSQGANGSVVYNNDGSFTYTSNTGFTGTDTFTYTISDGQGGTDTATVTMQVSNAAPTITSDGGLATATVNVPENMTAVTTVTANDSDGHTPTFSITGGADQALFTILPTGELSFIAAPDFEGPGDNSYEVEVTASDGHGGSDVQTITVNVTDVNESLTAVDDAYSVSEDAIYNSHGTGWFDSNWQYSRTLSFDNSTRTENLVDFPILVKLDSSVIDYAKTHDQGWDLRFFDQDGTALAHEIEHWDEAGTSYVWVKIPQIDASSSADSIVMYYGNAGVGSSGEDSAGVWSDYRATYHLNENPGATGTLADSAGNFDATNASSTDTAGIIGNAQDFNGVDQSINLGDDRNWINNASGATLSIWMNADTTSGFGDLIGLSRNDPADTGASRITLIRNGDDIQMIARTMDDSSDTVSVSTSTNPLSAGTWHHITGTVDYSSDTDNIKIYVDGQLEGTFSHNFTLDAIPNTDSSHAAIGSDEDGTDSPFDGQLDEARIANQVRSADWISAQYAAMTGNLVGIGAEQTVHGVLINDVDEDGDALTVTQMNGAPAAIGVATALPSGALVTLNADGSFVYDTNGAFESLAAGASTTDAFTYQVIDGNGSVETASVTMTIDGEDDAPSIGGTDSGAVTEDVGVVGGNISASGSLTISDDDAGESSFQAETITGTYGDLTIDGAGNWTYSADNNQAAIQQLDVTEFLTDTLTVTTADGSTHDVVITINGAEDTPQIGGVDVGTVAEDGTLTASDTLTITDVDTSDNPVSFNDVAATLGDNSYGDFEMTAGTWTYTLNNGHAAVQALDNGETLTDTFTFTATDGSPQLVTVTINGAEDAPVFDSSAVTAATEDVAYSYTITTSDVDVESVTITAPTLPGWLTFVDNGDGTASLSGTPTNAEVGSHNVVLNVSDGTLSSNQNFTITVANTNDPAVIAGVDTGSVQEDVGVVANNISTGGLLTIADPDTGESTFQAETVTGTYGDLTIDTAGNWTYAADNTQAAIQQLDVTEFLTDTLTVTSFDGTTHNVVITINGSEDAAVISGTTTGSVQEDGTLTSSGLLTITDTDSSDSPSFADVGVTAGDNNYGTFEMTSGTWTYTLNNAHPAVQALDVSETLTDTFTFTATDGSPQLVTVTINGAEDAPVFDSSAVTAATEDVAYSYTITTSDVDVESVTITAPTLPGWLTFVDNGDGTASLSGTPTNAEVGSHNVVLNVSDGTLSSNQNFTITVANTNDPAVIAGVDTGSVQEDVGVVANNISTGGLLTIADPDTGESTFQAETVTGTYGDLTIDTAGNWTYAADNTQAAIQQLDVTEFLTDTLTVTSFDGTTHNVVITINGSEDAAVISGTTTGSVTEDGTLTSSGALTIADTDTSDNPISFNDVAATLGDNGYGDFEITSNTWTYTLNNGHASVQALDVGETLTDTYTFAASDGSTQTVTVTINGAEDTAVISGTTTGSVAEDGTLTSSGALTITDTDTSDNPISFNDVTATLGDNGYGDFEITSNTWTYTLNNGHASVQALDVGETLTDTYTFVASDGSTQTVTVTINGAEDAAVIIGTATGTVAEDGTLTASDTLTITDADTSDNPISFNDVAATLGDNGYGDFEITSNTWTYTLNNGHTSVQALDVGETLTDTYTFTASDGSTQTVTVTINGAEDAAVIGGTAIGTVAEDGTLTASDTLTITDADTSDNPIGFNDVVPTLGDNGYGTFEITSNTWTYTLNNGHAAVQALDAGETLNDTFTFTASDGSTQVVTVTINGAEDGSVIGGTATGTVAEDGTLTTSDTLTITDSDTSDNPISFNDVAATSGDNGYGTFEMTAGTWTYTLNNAHPAVQALDVSETLTDTYTFTATDGSPQLVTVTINGAEDAPVFDSTAVTAATEDVAYSYTITTSDVDVESVTITAPTLPAWLTFVDNGDGTASLSGIPSNAEVGSHNVVLNVSDGTLSSNQNFTIVVSNTNSVPVIGGIDTGVVTEDRVDSTGKLTVAGALTITDPDVGQSNFVAQNIQGNFGAMTIDASGNWSYSADNSHAEIQALQAGESMTEILTVTTADGSTHDVEIIINGTAEAPPAPPPPEEPPPDDEPPADEPPEESEEDPGGSGEDPILEEVVHIPQDTRTPAPEQDSSFAQTNEPDSEPVDYSQLIDRQAARVQEQPQALKAQDLSIDTLTLQVTDNEALNEQFELELLERIDSMHLGMDLDAAQKNADDVDVQIFVGSTAGLTVGIVSWVLRGGALLASFMSTVPLLNRFDPLPILKAREDEEDVEPDGDDDEKTQIREHARKVDNMFSEKGDQQ